MESHVLLPRDLSLVSLPTSDCSSPSVARLLEQRVGVAAGEGGVEAGRRFHPAQGTVRCGRMEVYSALQQDDVSEQKLSRQNTKREIFLAFPPL